MIIIEKQNQEEFDTTKLVIKTSKDALTTPKLLPKDLKATQQTIKPDEPENTDSLFIIY